MTSAMEREELRGLDQYLRSHYPLWGYLITMFYILFRTQNMMVITTRPGKSAPSHSKTPYGSMIAINTTVFLCIVIPRFQRSIPALRNEF
ncbi:hypothetical protein BDR22DRAFT_682307 [Usnea florida]